MPLQSKYRTYRRYRLLPCLPRLRGAAHGHTTVSRGAARTPRLRKPRCRAAAPVAAVTALTALATAAAALAAALAAAGTASIAAATALRAVDKAATAVAKATTALATAVAATATALSAAVAAPAALATALCAFVAASTAAGTAPIATEGRILSERARSEPMRTGPADPTLVRRPAPFASECRMTRSVFSSDVVPTRSDRSVTRNRTPISSKAGGAIPASRQAAVIRCTPLPHCSISPSSWKTRPITRFRSFEMPRGRSSIISAKCSL